MQHAETFKTFLALQGRGYTQQIKNQMKRKTTMKYNKEKEEEEEVQRKQQEEYGFDVDDDDFFTKDPKCEINGSVLHMVEDRMC